MSFDKSKNKYLCQTRGAYGKFILRPDSPYEMREAFASLRTKLLFSTATKTDVKCKIFSITSPNPSEGKTITLVNTAISFAMLGKKVLIIDCDMRRPRIGRLFGVSQKNGLSNLLTGMDECYIHSLEDIPLSFITAGDIPPNPSELLSSVAFKTIIEQLKKDYDYIFFDSPPVNAVVDAQILSPMVDCFSLLVRAGSTLYHEAKSAEETLHSAGAKVCGIIVNDVDFKSLNRAYGRQSSKYGYHYYVQQGDR